MKTITIHVAKKRSIKSAAYKWINKKDAFWLITCHSLFSMLSLEKEKLMITVIISVSEKETIEEISI